MQIKVFKPKVIFYFLLPICFVVLAGIGKAQTLKKPLKLGTGQTLICEASPQIFPKDWLSAPDFTKADSLNPVDIEIVISIVKSVLAKYPLPLLKKSLQRIHIVQNFMMQKVEIGGCCDHATQAIYISFRNDNAEFLKESMHHEIAHLLLQKSKFSLQEWLTFNPPTFQYGNGGIEAVKSGKDGIADHEEYFAQGFRGQYAQSSPYEDAACIGAGLMSGDSLFWSAVDKYEILRKKVNYVLKKYERLDKTFTEKYFRSLCHTVEEKTYTQGELVSFPKGGKVVYPFGPVIDVPPGGQATVPPLPGGVVIY